MQFKTLVAYGAASLIMATSQPAFARDNADAGMQVSARIPAMCSLSSSTTIASESQSIATSRFFESCNTNRGFQVVASYRPLVEGEQADVTYDGLSSSLEASGFSLVQFRQGARHGPVDVEVATEQLQSPLAISFAMTPV